MAGGRGEDVHRRFGKGAGMTSHQALRLLSERLPEMRRLFAVRELALFGSAARDEAGPNSDFDLLVQFAGPPTFDGYTGLKLYLETALGREVDLVIESDLHPALRGDVFGEALRVA